MCLYVKTPIFSMCQNSNHFAFYFFKKFILQVSYCPGANYPAQVLLNFRGTIF